MKKSFLCLWALLLSVMVYAQTDFELARAEADRWAQSHDGVAPSKTKTIVFHNSGYAVRGLVRGGELERNISWKIGEEVDYGLLVDRKVPLAPEPLPLNKFRLVDPFEK